MTHGLWLLLHCKYPFTLSYWNRPTYSGYIEVVLVRLVHKCKTDV